MALREETKQGLCFNLTWLSFELLLGEFFDNAFLSQTIVHTMQHCQESSLSLWINVVESELGQSETEGCAGEEILLLCDKQACKSSVVAIVGGILWE